MKRAGWLALGLLFACSAGEAGPSQSVEALTDAGFQLGVYHLPDRPDAFDVELRADGSFRWLVDGCDYGGGDIGRWQVQDDQLTLLPRAGRAKLRWMNDVVFNAEVGEVVLHDASAQGFSATVQGAEQPWQTGGVCAVCGGSLGPTSATRCDDPFQDVPDETLAYD